MSDSKGEAKQSVHGPILVLIRGLPGSGKSYLTEALRTKLDEGSLVMLDPDMIDYSSEEYKKLAGALTGEGVEEKFHPYRFLRSQAHQAILDHKIIVWSQPFTLASGFERTIKNIRGFAADHNIRLPILAVELAIDPTIAKARVSQRIAQGGHGPSGGRFARFVDEYVSFAGMDQDRTITVDGEANVDTSAAILIKALQEIQK